MASKERQIGAHILVVDDDTLLRRSLSLQLEQAGFRASTAESAEDAIPLAQRDPPDLILLDIGLPGMDGMDALKVFQDEMDIPVIFLTARRRELDTILGLELGADDYITKPFNPDILIAHIKAVLRRASKETVSRDSGTSVQVGDLIIDPSAHTVEIAGDQLELTAREFALLHALALEPGVVISVDDLLTRVWGAEFIGEPQVVYVHIRWLREKIEDDPQHPQRIMYVRGIGYKLVPQTESK